MAVAVFLVQAIAVFGGPLQAQESRLPASVLPVVVQDGIATVQVENTVTLLPSDRRLIRMVFPDNHTTVLGETQTGAAEGSLRRLYATGQAAGNHGDLYENRDRGHSTLPEGAFPQLTRVTYGEKLRAARVDYGAALGLIFDAPLIGNSSMAATGGRFWRSLPRLILTQEGGPARLFQNYVAGQIHVYPEHKDHDPELGDLLPANTPYYLVSQGSSGFDQMHLEALAMILAAFRPDTKARLRETGLIAPTVQMVYRRARVLSREAYLSGAAHPSVFGAEEIVAGRMVSLANAIAPDSVPPMIRLEVVAEDLAEDERYFDTPSAIARIWRHEAFRREMVVSAEGTRDPNGRELMFSWVLLRGDPENTLIEPLDEKGRRARIEVSWQQPRATPGRNDVLSSRVDIGVFAHNGVFDSAPAFISILLPRHEQRVYELGQDGDWRLVRSDKVPRDEVYVDPLLFPDEP
ncbi:hypothetical protein [Marimonas arenosa]|uniref:Uncharacterized protein n=1 Tax=Marimonas arenosa TaxID=1795305 RepID=A0AAE3WDA0_9RHOB|nr:hypothetical protein [Marimonas arenosa]MDQ2089657.1 hypothetical protein [Marimonas arenosa]